MKRGFFITFEGSEGSGKSTQARLLCDYLLQAGHRVNFIREPGGTRIGEKIRTLILDCRNDDISSLCETVLYMAARAQLVEEVIEPQLSKGMIVICDRFLDSTVAYQGYGLGMDIEAIRNIGRFVTKEIAPDITIVLDQPVAHGLRHRQDNRDRIEKRSLAYHQRVRRGYLKLASKYPRRIKVVRVEKDIEHTHEHIRALVEQALR